MNYKEKIVIIGAGVAGVSAATKLVNEGYPGDLITIIDIGKDPYRRKPEEVMHGYCGAGLFSDGKIAYLSNAVGGHLTKYCGETKAQQLVDEGMEIIKQFHPDHSQIIYSAPIEEPEFIKPYFNLRLSPTYHIGTDILHKLGKIWYDFLIDKGVNFMFNTEVTDIDFDKKEIDVDSISFIDGNKVINMESILPIKFDRLLYGTGKSGIDLTQKLIDKYNLKKEPKSVQLGVRFSCPQYYFQKMLDIAYDFKLYKKHNEKVSSRSFCTNSGGAYVAEENTYDMKSYNGHSFRDKSMETGMVNFGIIMEIKNVDNPFKFQKDIVSKCQIDGKGIHYSPNFTRKPSLNAEGEEMNLHNIGDINIFKQHFGKYSDYVIEYINDLNKVFKFENDYSLYIPEVKFLSEEVLVNYNNLSLIDYPNIHFMGDSLSSRGIIVSMAQGIYCSMDLLKNL